MRATSCILVGHDIHTGRESESSAEARVSASVETVLGAIDELEDEGFRFVGVDEFLRRRRQERLALLSFDDGYQSVYAYLLPRLRERGIPTLMFLTTGGRPRRRDPFPVWLFGLRDNRKSLPDAAIAALEALPEVQRVLRRAAESSLRDLLGLRVADLYPSFREALAAPELERLGDAITELELIPATTLSDAQVESMQSSGWVELAAHSVSHIPFSELTPSEIEREVVESCRWVARLADRPPSELAFAYPYGAFTPSAEQIVRRHCKAGFTTANRRATPMDRDSSIPRVNLDPSSLALARSATSAARTRAILEERARLRIRHGRAWRFVGPVVHALRRHGHGRIEKRLS